ncbi:unnamed protein product [Urochloa humidicola]
MQAMVTLKMQGSDPLPWILPRITTAWLFNFFIFHFARHQQVRSKVEVWTTRGLLGCGLTLDPLFKLPVSRP